MENLNYFVAVIVFLCVQQWVLRAEASTSYYLTDLCQKRNFSVIRTSFTGQTSAGTIFVSKENEGFPSNLSCKVTIRPTSIYQHGIIVKVDKSVTPEPAMPNGDGTSRCEDYRMEYLSSHSSIDERYKNITRCFTNGVITFQSASSVHFYFNINNASSSLAASSFRITFTNYQIDFCKDKKGFSCTNNNCIWKVLVCDGRNNCGDNSDEEQFECGHKQPTFFGSVWNKPTDLMSLFGLVLACLTLFAVAASAFYLCGKTLRYRQTSTATTPTIYSNEGTIYPTEKQGYAAVTNLEYRQDRPPPYTYG